MSKREQYHVSLPPEIGRIAEADLSALAELKWTPQPQIERGKNGMVDAVRLLEPLLGNPILDRTLRTVDVLNGCGRQCGTCFADALLPSRMFSQESLFELFSDERFLKMLMVDSIRFGSSGDILDHPNGVEIVKLALAATKELGQLGDREHLVKILTNYRPRSEAELDDLLKLKEENRRLDLTISLPFNINDEVNQSFYKYALARPEHFRRDVGRPLEVSGVGVRVTDVRHPRMLFMMGRILSDEANGGRISYVRQAQMNERFFDEAGMVKTYLNPDGLWLMMYATIYESHTSRLFTLITPENIELLSQLPFHRDFATPPNWKGGKGLGSYLRRPEFFHAQPKPMMVVPKE